jgi:polysaccharide biosynthesis transport protein
MSILQFLRILWARWATIAILTFSAAAGAFVVTLLVPPRYESKARIMLNLTRPDPVTGQVINVRGGIYATPYLDEPRELIGDYKITGRVVDRLNWLSDPGLIRAYERRPPSDGRDFRRWLAQRVADNTEISVDGASIVVIKFRAGSPEEARIGAETMRQAYFEESLAQRRAYATRTGEWYRQQATKARAAAEQAEVAKAAYEKETGVLLTDGDVDLDTTRLAALAGQMNLAPSASVVTGTSQASLALAQLDADMSEASQSLGPNHPKMQELRRRREQVARVAAQESQALAAAASGESGAGAISRALQDQKQRVIAQRDKIERLRQLQAEVELRRDEYKRTAARAGELALESNIADTGATPVGTVLAPTEPSFPNKPLMVGGATILGAALGFALSLLLELMNRRVRGVEDLDISDDILCIGVVEEPGALARVATRRQIKSFLPFQKRVIA